MREEMTPMPVLLMVVLAAAALAADEPPRFVLAEEDTFALSSVTLDTLLVEAPRLKVSDIVRLIGERMAADEERMGDHAWTQITRVVARPQASEAGERDRTEYEIVERLRIGRDGAVQSVRVRSVERTFKGGVLDKEKTDDEIESDWSEITGSRAGVPFDLESDEYNYAIAGRHLLDDRHLVYEIRFEPRSEFAALPSGTVWLDWSDYVIRQFEGSFEHAVPVPLFVREIPWFRVRRQPCGGFWVVTDVIARIELRQALPGIPASLEMRVQTLDHSIDGVDCGIEEEGP